MMLLVLLCFVMQSYTLTYESKEFESLSIPIGMIVFSEYLGI